MSTKQFERFEKLENDRKTSENESKQLRKVVRILKEKTSFSNYFWVKIPDQSIWEHFWDEVKHDGSVKEICAFFGDL